MAKIKKLTLDVKMVDIDYDIATPYDFMLGMSKIELHATADQSFLDDLIALVEKHISLNKINE